MWKIVISTTLSLFVALWIAIVGMKIVKKLLGNDDDTWPPGAATA